MTWRDRAACRTLGPDIFFHGASRGAALLEALATCNSCPVQDQCREYVLADPDLAWPGTGIWAGLTAHEREVIRGQRRARRQRRSAAA